MDRPEKISFMYEISRGCNLHCEFCYNTWRASAPSGGGQLDSRPCRDLLAKVIAETGCADITLSGGEPLLRDDIFEMVSFIKNRGVKVGLTTNGTLLDRETADKCISHGVDSFQITLLSDKAETHNRLSGAGAFESVLDAIITLRDAGATVSTFFVGLADNIGDFRSALELNVLLGVTNVALGRFIPGGKGLGDWRNLMPSPDMLDEALAAAEAMSKRYPVAVSVSTPILPCLHDFSKYRSVRFAFCAVARQEHSLFAIDPQGNLKACSHSPVILGNLIESSFDDLIKHQFLEDFSARLPAFCRDCPEAETCRGGCRSAAHVCYGSLEEEDPYLKVWKSRASRPVRLVPGGA